LHVAVHLNHWQESKVAASAITERDSAITGSDSAEAVGTSATTSAELNLQPEVPLELQTWIRETRRMRSEEIHFLDSPTIGVLVFFRKVEPKQ
ncbi:MAG: CsiV family protein, partial [Marinobacter sp.]